MNISKHSKFEVLYGVVFGMLITLIVLLIEHVFLV